MQQDKNFSSFMANLIKKPEETIDGPRLLAQEILNNPSTSHLGVAVEGVVPNTFDAFALDITNMCKMSDEELKQAMRLEYINVLNLVADQIDNDHNSNRIRSLSDDMLIQTQFVGVFNAMPKGTERILLAYAEDRDIFHQLKSDEKSMATFIVVLMAARSVDRRQDILQVETFEVTL